MNSHVFEIANPTGRMLPDYKPPDINRIPCHETLSRFIAPEASKTGWDHRQMTLSEMVRNDLPDGSKAEEMETRISDLNKIVEISQELEMPLGTKKSGKNVSRVDRRVKTNTQNAVREGGVEAFNVVWNALITTKESGEDKGVKISKRARDGRQTERKKQKQRISDTEQLIV